MPLQQGPQPCLIHGLNLRLGPQAVQVINRRWEVGLFSNVGL